MEYYLGTKKNEILPFMTTWMELEGIMISEVNETERQKTYHFTFMWNLKSKQNRKTHKRRKHILNIKTQKDQVNIKKG